MIDHCAKRALKGEYADEKERFSETSAKKLSINVPEASGFDYSDVFEEVQDGKDALPKEMTDRGILGPERIDNGVMFASLVTTKNSRIIDRAAAIAVSENTGKKHRDGVFSVYYHGDSNGRWAIVRGAKSTTTGHSSTVVFEDTEYHPAAFVAITKTKVQYVGHKMKRHSDFTHSLGSFKCNNKLLTNQLTVESEEALDILSKFSDGDALSNMILEPGDMFFTVDGMPVHLSPVDGAAEFLVKFIGLEQVSKISETKSRIKTATRDTFTAPNGISRKLHFSNDWLCFTLCKALGLTNKDNIAAYETASIEDFPEFKKNEKKAKEEKEGEEAPKKTKSPKADESTINELLAEGREAFKAFEALDPLVRVDKDADAFRNNFEKLKGGEHRAVLLTSYRKTLKTFCAKIRDGQENQDNHLKTVKDTLSSIHATLEDTKIPMGDDYKKKRTAHEDITKKLDALKTNQNNLTFQKFMDAIQKLEKAATKLHESVLNKREKSTAKIAKKSNDPTLVNPNEELPPISYEPIFKKAADGREFEPRPYPSHKSAVQDVMGCLAKAKALIGTFPKELTENETVDHLVKNYVARMKARSNAFRDTVQKETQDDSVKHPCDFGDIFGMYNHLKELLDDKAAIDADYEEEKLRFEERMQVMLNPVLKNHRAKSVYGGMSEAQFSQTIQKRYRLLESGQKRWNSSAAKQNRKGREVTLEFIGDSDEESAWDTFHEKMGDADEAFDKWRKKKSDANLCTVLAGAVQEAEKLLPAQYHDINNPDDVNRKGQDDEEIEADEEEELELKEQFDVSSDQEEVSDYDEDEESFASESGGDGGGRKRDREAEAAVMIVEAICDVPVEKERDAALKHFKAGNYEAAMDEIEPILKADKAYGFEMKNKNTGTKKPYAYFYLDPEERDTNMEAWSRRSEAFEFSPIERNLKREREEEEEEEESSPKRSKESSGEEEEEEEEDSDE